MYSSSLKRKLQLLRLAPFCSNKQHNCMHEMVHYAWHGIDEGWCHVSIGVQSCEQKKPERQVCSAKAAFTQGLLE